MTLFSTLPASGTRGAALGRWVCRAAVWGLMLVTLVLAESGRAGAQGPNAQGPNAQGPNAQGWVAGQAPVEAKLIAAVRAVGDLPVVRAGVAVKLSPGWKTYWRNPGDAGLPPGFDWAASGNVASAVHDFPTPHRFSVLGIETAGYDGTVIFPVTVTPKVPGQPLALRVAADLLVCAEICVPERLNLALDLPSGPAAPSGDAQDVARAFAAVPGEGRDAGWWLRGLTVQGNTLTVDIATDTPMGTPDVFVDSDPPLAFAAPVRAPLQTAMGNVTRLTTRAAETGLPVDLTGKTLTVTVVDGARAAAFTAAAQAGQPGPVSQAGPAGAPLQPLAAAAPSLGQMLILALLGGLILNLMPCVLPVLSLKLLAAVRHGGEAWPAVRGGFLATAAGIVTSFLVLAGGTLAVKAAGGAVGWGIQFQQPLFLGFMIALVLLFAGNLAGLFEVPLPRFLADRLAGGPGGGAGTGVAPSFAAGAFATLLATPCSAPFLGTAVGFALAAGPREILAIFLMLGVGMALPYLVVAAIPASQRLLPRPGPWMITLRRGLALCLVGTAVWLGSVLALQVREPVAVAKAETVAGIAWQPFDEGTIAGLVGQGRVVFVDVTAAWCLTCQANEKLVLSRGTVAERLQMANVVSMRADWTRPDPRIAAYLAAHGRYGIPFNIVYGPGTPEGVALPELLSDSAVLDALARADGGPVAARRLTSIQ